ncbi:MAG TPA: aminotransferase class III-fold pyridoxal phosphate-dependent enzyme, partial [Candidatus Binatus sp.]|nr:aminotransferase class III-fold pyridoxal phosphate-dependent enzyme [Candidatus Binatus sp.]
MYTQVEEEAEAQIDRSLGSPRTAPRNRSASLFNQALKVLPSGASSMVRVHKHGSHPVLLKRGEGSRVWDLDGNEYVDLLSGYGSLILGHSHPSIVKAITAQLRDGTILGTTTELEIEVGRKIQDMVPCADKVAFSNTGTEATMEAVRIARAFTGKEKLLKFEGHYHGHHDYVLFSVDGAPGSLAGLEHAPHKLAYYPGIPKQIAETLEVTSWNNTELLEKVLKRRGNEIAAIIMEPVMGSAGIIPPAKDYLQSVRELADQYDVLLIFDEVLTGFRLALGGAQEYYQVQPDLACFAKALGGGVPVAAVAGRD